ncbi:MAG: hypothetical protein HZC48_07095 [Nitrospirae bacterium]|nr:hypothetical protein [Nitrospirota bacterium]
MSDIINEDSITWSDIKKYREEARRLFPSILKIPVIYSTKKDMIKNVLYEFNGKLLDVGGGDRFVKEICSNSIETIEYKSMDIDNKKLHDYYSMEEINEKFNGILLLDIMEHLSLAEGGRLLQKCNQLMVAGGNIFLTIPNNYHPTAFYVDCTHTTSYRYHDLGGLLLLIGFKNIQIFRVSTKRKLKHRLLALLFKPLMKFFDIDFATGIFIIANKAV